MLIGVKEIIKRTINLYKDNFNIFLTYIALLFIPTGITAILAPIVDTLLMQKEFPAGSVALAIYLIVMLLSWVATFWISITFIRIFYKKYEDIRVQNIKEELQTSVSLIITAGLVSILASLMIFAGFLLFIIPGIIFAVWFAFAVYEAAIEGKKINESLKLSKTLVKGRWWSVLWRLIGPVILFGLAMIIVNGIIGGSFGMILSTMTENTVASTFMNIVVNLILSFVGLLFTPLTSGAPIILYSELKKTPVAAKAKKS